MRKEYKIILAMIVMMGFICLFGLNKVEAASATLTESKTVYKGDSVTVTGKVVAGAWDVTLKRSGKKRA